MAGLSEKELKKFEDEEKELGRMGIPTKVKSVDEQVKTYYNNQEGSKKKLTIKRPGGLGVNVGSVSGKKPRLLKVTTFGFENGELKHNMPCPVCLSEPARYVSNDDGNYFAPCELCEAAGFTLEKNRKRGGGFWG